MSCVFVMFILNTSLYFKWRPLLLKDSALPRHIFVLVESSVNFLNELFVLVCHIWVQGLANLIVYPVSVLYILFPMWLFPYVYICSYFIYLFLICIYVWFLFIVLFVLGSFSESSAIIIGLDTSRKSKINFTSI